MYKRQILILPDFYIPGTETKINPFTAEEPVRTVAKRIQRIREIGQTICQVAGGEAIHPSNTRIGGMYRNCSDLAKTKMYDLAKEGLVLAHAQSEFMIAVIRSYHKRDFVDVGGMKVPMVKELGYHNQGYLATHAFYGSSSQDECPSWDINRFKEVRPWDWYMGEMEISLEEPKYPICLLYTSPSPRD